MGQKKDAKLEDIARALNVSIVSVSNALNGRKGVGKELRRKVLEKAQEIGYSVQETSVKRELKSYSIGVIVAERYVKEFPSFYMDLYKHVAQAAAKKGCLTVLEIVDVAKEDGKMPGQFFVNMGIQGIVIVGEMKREFVREVKKQNHVPIVGVDFYELDDEVDYIISDSLHGMQRMTQKLIDAGHREIAFLGNIHSTKNIMDRYMGYRKALLINDIELRSEWVIDDRSEKYGGYAIEFELPEKIPGAFAVNCDKSAYILIDKLRKSGLRVPEDVSVVGFDYSSPQVHVDFALTTYESDQKAMAAFCIKTLIKRIEGKKYSKDRDEGILIVDGRVIEGTTVSDKRKENRWVQ